VQFQCLLDLGELCILVTAVCLSNTSNDKQRQDYFSVSSSSEWLIYNRWCKNSIFARRHTGRCLKLGFPRLTIIIIMNKSIEFGGANQSPFKNVTSNKMNFSTDIRNFPDICDVQKLFLAQEEFSLLIWLNCFHFYFTNLVNQDWFYLIDSQIMVNRDRISFI
jgi:hypothetical protein